jgi:DnaJ domain
MVAASHYGLLGISASASVRDIRQAYRELSKQYHPDTTTLPREVAIERFRQLNEAYAILSNPERRSTYDQKIGYSQVPVVQPLSSLNSPVKARPTQSSSAYLDATDRPLSAGEVFALFILGLTFLACLVLAIAIGLTRGEAVFQPFATQSQPAQSQPVEAPAQSPIPSQAVPSQAAQLRTAQLRTAPAVVTPIVQPPPVKPAPSIVQPAKPQAPEAMPSVPAQPIAPIAPLPLTHPSIP